MVKGVLANIKNCIISVIIVVAFVLKTLLSVA